MAVLSKNQIDAAKDSKVVIVNVPEWGGEVGIRIVTGTERDAFETAYAEKKTHNFRARFLAYSLCDENGIRLYDDDDIELIGKKAATVVNRLFEEAWKVNAFTNEAVEELGNA